MTATATRRGVLAMLAATPIVTSAATSQWAETPFRAAAARLNAADATREAYYNNVFDPAHDLLIEARTRLKALVDAVPHAETTRSFTNVMEQRKTLSTESEVSVFMARKVVADPPSYVTDSDSPEYLDTLRELIALADERDAKVAIVAAENPLPEMPDEDMYASERYEALDALIEAPVRDFTEFVEKLAILRQRGCLEDADDPQAYDAVLRDVAILAGVA